MDSQSGLQWSQNLSGTEFANFLKIYPSVSTRNWSNFWCFTWILEPPTDRTCMIQAHSLLASTMAHIRSCCWVPFEFSQICFGIQACKRIANTSLTKRLASKPPSHCDNNIFYQLFWCFSSDWYQLFWSGSLRPDCGVQVWVECSCYWQEDNFLANWQSRKIPTRIITH